MSPGQKRVVHVLLAVVWLAVVGLGMFLAITRREEYGYSAYIALGIGAAMLVIFVLNYLPRNVQKKTAAEWAGDLATAVLILGAVAVLGYSIVVGKHGIFGTLVLLVFFITFIRIFRDYVKHLQEKRNRKGK